MSNQILSGDTISVHGRGSFVEQYRLVDQNGDQIDISGWTVFFEVDGLANPIREQLVTDPSDPKGLLIRLERSQIEQLSKSAAKCAIINETNVMAGLPLVLWSGTIKRTGYVGSPDSKKG